MIKVGLTNIPISLYGIELFGEGVVIGRMKGYKESGLLLLHTHNLNRYNFSNVRNILIEYKRLHLLNKIEDELPNNVVVWVVDLPEDECAQYLRLVDEGYDIYTYIGNCKFYKWLATIKGVRNIVPDIIKSEACYIRHDRGIDSVFIHSVTNVTRTSNGEINHSLRTISDSEYYSKQCLIEDAKTNDRGWIHTLRENMKLW